MTSIDESDTHHCPLCYKKFDADTSANEMLSHIKRCYHMRRIKEDIRQLKSPTRNQKFQTMSDTIDSVNEEINNYWSTFLESDTHFY